VKFAQKLVKEAHKIKIPLIADVIQSRTGPELVQVMHYGHLADFSLSEITLINAFAKAVAANNRGQVHYTLDVLHYNFDDTQPPNKRRDERIARLQAETIAAVDYYVSQR